MARLGMVTPSSNTVVEPVTCAMVAENEAVTVHFSRFRVTRIALSQDALDQFDDRELLGAAELLAHAKVDVIAWNGTSASWLGFDRDERLCDRITAATGIPACTSVLAFREVLQRTAARRIGLVTPYLPDVQDAIMATWNAAGLRCVAERHLSLDENFAFAAVSEDQLAGMIRAVVAEGAEAVAILCTNLRGARIAARLEQELGVPIYDSVAVTLWKSLALAETSFDRLSAWGSLFTHPALRPTVSPGTI